MKTASRTCTETDTLTELVRALAAQERLAKAAHALAEAEERAEDEPEAAAEVERCRKLHDAAEAAVGFARARCWELEARLEPAEVARAHAMLAGGGRG